MSHDHDHDAKTVWTLAKDIGMCMLITHDAAANRHRARPMHAYVEPDEHAIYFLTDADSAKAHQAEKDATVTIAFADTGKNNYATISGAISVSNDRDKIRELFNPFAKAWWDSAEDPSIRVLKLAPDEAEYWESPNGVVSTIKMLAAAATNHRPDLGENAKLRL